MLTVVDIRNTQSGVIVDVKAGGILPFSLPFSEFKILPLAVDALVEFAITDPEHDAFHMDELPRPEAEAQAVEASEINGKWLDKENQPPAATVAAIRIDGMEAAIREAEHADWLDEMRTREDNRPR